MNTDSLQSELIDEVKLRIDEVAARAKMQGFVSLVKGKSFIERNPFQSVAVAVGIGWALKLLKPGPVITAGVAGGLVYLATRFKMQ